MYPERIAFDFNRPKEQIKILYTKNAVFSVNLHLCGRRHIWKLPKNFKKRSTDVPLATIDLVIIADAEETANMHVVHLADLDRRLALA